MKVYHCKIKGVVTAEGCFDCYTVNNTKYSSRVLCQKDNISEDLTDDFETLEKEKPLV